jgi:hypothetical protein
MEMTPYHFGRCNPNYWADPSGLRARWWMNLPLNSDNDFIDQLWAQTPLGGSSTWMNIGGGLFQQFNVLDIGPSASASGGGVPTGNFVSYTGEFIHVDWVIELPELVIVLPKKQHHFQGYFDGPNSGEYGPSSISFGIDLSSLIDWFTDNLSGFIFNDGEMKDEFTGEKRGKNGVIYGVMQTPLAPNPNVYNTIFNQTLTDVKLFSDLFAVQLEIAGALKDANIKEEKSTKKDSIRTIWFGNDGKPIREEVIAE